jgi:RNA polymerase sigma factor (sigma-70 family)
VKADNAIASIELWNAFRNGDKRAFESIYRSHVKDLLAYGYKVIVDRRLIEDSVHDLFFELWQSRKNLSDTTSIKFYLFKALRYKMIRNARVSGMAIVHSIDEVENDAAAYSHEKHLIDIEEQSLQAIHLQNIIGRLPKRQQEAINLRFYHNFSNDQVAEILEVNYQSACKLIYGALKTLKANFTVLSNP